MALNGILNTALSGLFTNQQALRVISNNVANVNNENYTRLRVQQQAVVLQGQGAGVKTASIERVVDEFLVTATRTSISNTEEFTVQREFHDRLQGILGNPASESSLSARLDRSFQSLSALALAPADSLRRQQAISELDNFLNQVGTFENQLQALRTDVSQKITENVENANELLRQIHELNPLLVRQSTVSNDAGAIEGQLDGVLNELANIIDIRVERLPTGAVTVRTVTGQPLVDTSLSQLSYNGPGSVSSETIFPPVQLQRVDANTLQPEGNPIEITGGLGSGRIQGLLELRDNQFNDLAESFGELGARVRDTFNEVHNRFTAVPAPNQLVGQPTIIDGKHDTGFTGIVTFSTVDQNNKLVASHTVDFGTGGPEDFDALVSQVNTGLGGTGALALVNGVLTFTGSGANGVAISDDADTPSNRAGRGFSHFFGLNDLITSRSDGIFETGITGAEDHNIAAPAEFTLRIADRNNQELSVITVPVTEDETFNDILGELNDVTGAGAFFTFSFNTEGKLIAVPRPPRTDLRIQVRDDTTRIGGASLSFTGAFGLGDGARTNAAKDLRVREEIADNPNRLSLAQVNMPAAAGDTVITDGDQRGALAFQDIETSLVRVAAAGELRSADVSLSNYTSRVLGSAGLQARRASNLEEDNQSLRLELEQRRSDVSGVNMDEELANLVLFQNAYNASARILSSVQELYDTLLQIV